MIKILPNFRQLNKRKHLYPEFYNKSIQNIIFDLIILNPPFLKEWFLVYLSQLLQLCKGDCMMVSINPARWFTDPNKNQKRIHSYKIREAASILERHCHRVDLLQDTAGNKLFKISSFCDLGYFVFKEEEVHCKCPYTSDLYCKTINAVHNYVNNNLSLKNYIDRSKHKNGTHKVYIKNLFLASSGFDMIVDSSNDYKYTLTFNTLEEAQNCEKYLRLKAIRNLQYLMAQNQHAEFGCIPMPDNFTRSWSDCDVATMLNLSSREFSYLMRDIADYRVRDYFDYTIYSTTKGIRYTRRNSLRHTVTLKRVQAKHIDTDINTLIISKTDILYTNAINAAHSFNGLTTNIRVNLKEESSNPNYYWQSPTPLSVKTKQSIQKVFTGYAECRFTNNKTCHYSLNHTSIKRLRHEFQPIVRIRGQCKLLYGNLVSPPAPMLQSRLIHRYKPSYKDWPGAYCLIQNLTSYSKNKLKRRYSCICA